MKNLSIAAILFSGLISVAAYADECAQTCESEYSECKEAAETTAAKQACEDDVKECKAGCSGT
jgi:hypothetical protein